MFVSDPGICCLSPRLVLRSLLAFNSVSKLLLKNLEGVRVNVLNFEASNLHGMWVNVSVLFSQDSGMPMDPGRTFWNLRMQVAFS